MIKSFAHKGLELFYRHGRKAGIQPKHAKKLDLILAALDAATTASEMNLPGLVFHLLKPSANNIYSVRVDENYRVTFRFVEGNAEIVDYLDYH